MITPTSELIRNVSRLFPHGDYYIYDESTVWTIQKEKADSLTHRYLILILIYEYTSLLTKITYLLSCKPEGSIKEKQKQCNNGLWSLGMNIGRKKKHSDLSKTAFLWKRKVGYILHILGFQEKKTNYLILRLLSERFASLPGHLTLPHFISHMLSRPDSRFTRKRLQSQGYWEWSWGQKFSGWRMELWFMLGCKFKFRPGLFYLSNPKSKNDNKRKTTCNAI